MLPTPPDIDEMNLIATAEYREKRSVFTAYLFEVHSKEEEKECLDCVKEKEKGAKHILKAGRYPNAYGIQTSVSSENKEPINSMKKTASVMEKREIENRLIVIARHYGGVQLGAAHLDSVYFDLALSLMDKNQ